MVLISAGSLVDFPGPESDTGTDKLQHFLAYLVLASLGNGIVSGAGPWRVAVRCLLLGVAMEIAQALLTDTRQADWVDLLANAGGVLAAWLLSGGPRAGWARHVEAWLVRRQHG